MTLSTSTTTPITDAPALFIPEIGTTCFGRLYSGHAPRRMRLDAISDTDSNVMTITLFSNRPHDSDDESREIDITENGFAFFDAPLDSKYYFIILQLSDNSYDALDVHEGETFMSMEAALKEAELLCKNSVDDHEVAVRLNDARLR